jgi:hypothetical protein
MKMLAVHLHFCDAFEEGKHPRSKGGSQGGQFVKKGQQGSAASKSTKQASPDAHQFIQQVIKEGKFEKKDVKWATEGQCASFALALYSSLKASGLNPQIMVNVPASKGKPEKLHPAYRKSYPNGSGYAWNHVFVKVGNNYYDVEGARQEADLKKKYKSGEATAFVPTTPNAIKADVDSMKKEQAFGYGGSRSDPADQYENWKARLTKPAMQIVSKTAAAFVKKAA